ncbi:MAG: methyltransferase domain-containing protein, partial [Chloroflexi bacterium CFX6]|nr:methyltransferase domain-containing protein [Chloroflexi bacterium CFX6]
GRVGWVRGDGQRLPFADAAFDAVTSAFVLRNFADLPAAYADMARVVRPGGRVVALEISPDSAPLWRPLFELYFGRVVPRLGGWITGDATAYRYLPASVAAFLAPDELAAVMRGAGLVPLPPRRLMLGSLVIHIGFRPR